MTEEQRVSLDEAFAHLGKQLKVVCDVLMIATGELRATRLALDVVIESHPSPERLHELWQQVLPEVVDDLHSEETNPHAAMQNEGWKRVLAHYSELFEVMRDREKGRDEPA